MKIQRQNQNFGAKKIADVNLSNIDLKKMKKAFEGKPGDGLAYVKNFIKQEEAKTILHDFGDFQILVKRVSKEELAKTPEAEVISSKLLGKD